MHGKRTFLKEKWPLGRKGLLRQGHCQPIRVTVNPFSYSDLQHLQTGRLLSSEIRKQKMSHCHIVAVRRSNRSPDGVGRFKVQGSNALSRVQGENHPCPSLGRRGVQSCLRTTFIMHYALLIMN